MAYTLEDLTNHYGGWIARQGLPDACALELLLGADLNPYQRAWLKEFYNLWMDTASA